MAGKDNEFVVSLEGGREGREGRGGEGRGEGGREEGGKGGRGGMTVIHIILMAPQYLYNNDVTYYVNIRLGLLRITMVCITSDVTCNSRTESQIKP